MSDDGRASIISKALIFLTKSRSWCSWSFIERPGMFLMGAFLAAQLNKHSLLLVLPMP
ncbi:unnamed protein product [Rhodiola kirilowii]